MNHHLLLGYIRNFLPGMALPPKLKFHLRHKLVFRAAPHSVPEGMLADGSRNQRGGKIMELDFANTYAH